MEPKPNAFEIERDDLLAYYEASPAYRRAGDYTPEAFEGRRRAYFHRLEELLDRYSAAYPHFRDAFGLELSRPRPRRHTALLTSELASYEFDGLILSERLERRVGRLHLQPNASLFSGFIEGPNYESSVAQQQRYHFERAVQVAKELAQAATRELLTTEGVKSALLRLRAFGPANYPLIHEVLGPSPSQEQAQWWERIGLLASRTYLQAATRASHEAAYGAYNHTQVAPLLPNEARNLVNEAKLAALWPKANVPFSPAFYARYFIHVALPAVYHSPETRIILGVAALYVSPAGSLSIDKQKAWLHCIQRLVAEKPTLATTFFDTLNHAWPTDEKPADRLEQHLKLSRWLGRGAPSIITTFYEALGTHLDLEEDATTAERIAHVMELARLVQPGRRLFPAQAELSAHAADVCHGLYQQLDLRLESDQFALRDLYPLLVNSLDSDEVEVIEEILVDGLVAGDNDSLDASAAVWLQGDGLLAKRLRSHLRLRIQNHPFSSKGHGYTKLKELMLAFGSILDIKENDGLMLSKYDIDYFMKTINVYN